MSNIEAFKLAAPTTGPRSLVGHVRNLLMADDGSLLEAATQRRRKSPADLVVEHVGRARGIITVGVK
jgi:hypothetical protein